MDNRLGLESAWVSGHAMFPGYLTANSYPRSTFDLAVFTGKQMVCLQSFFLVDFGYLKLLFKEECVYVEGVCDYD